MNKLFIALVAFIAFICVASVNATITQQDLLGVDELNLLQQQIQMGFFNEEELLIIADALEAQEQFLVSAKATKSTGAWGSIKSFFSNTYVQYIGLGLATALVLAVAVTLAVIVIKKMRASKADKQGTASQEEEKGLLQPYDAVV